MDEHIVRATQRFIGLFDILGFSNIVTSNKLSHLTKTMQDFFLSSVNLAFDTTSQYIDLMFDTKQGLDAPTVHYRLFSDTILLYTETNDEFAFWNMVECSCRLMNFSLNQGFPLRGAITTGECLINDELIIGKPIVEAHLMEAKQEWAGCWISDSCAKLLKDLSCWRWAIIEKRIIKYRVPLKQGAVKNRWVINWPEFWRNDYQDFGWLMTFRLPEYKPSWEVNRKINYTQEFFEYIKKPIKERLNRRHAEIKAKMKINKVKKVSLRRPIIFGKDEKDFKRKLKDYISEVTLQNPDSDIVILDKTKIIEPGMEEFYYALLLGLKPKE